VDIFVTNASDTPIRSGGGQITATLKNTYRDVFLSVWRPALFACGRTENDICFSHGGDTGSLRSFEM
jgi:hypothetical protein